MTANEFLSLVSGVSGLLGIIASMAGMGLGLIVAQVTTPLKNSRLVVLMLLANFVLVPLFAFVITRIIPLDESLKIGLIIVACSAGAPFLVLEALGAKANMGVAVGMMTLLIIPLILLPLAKQLGARVPATAPDA